jgi:hypothetical protein
MAWQGQEEEGGGLVIAPTNSAVNYKSIKLKLRFQFFELKLEVSINKVD